MLPPRLTGGGRWGPPGVWPWSPSCCWPCSASVWSSGCRSGRMTHRIKLTNVDLDYFVYSLRSQSLRSAVFNLAVGGKMYKAAGDVAAVKALHDINLEINEGDRIELGGHH